MPKLSIITVNLNNKAGFAATAESVIAQTWTDYEWIIIDGGSTDGGEKLILEYAKKTPKLTYHCSEKDGGIYFGMNKGIAKASGEYCYFLNSGDCFREKTTLGEVFAHEFDEDIVYGDRMAERWWDGKPVIRRYGGKVRCSDLVYGFLQHQSMLLKRELLDGKNGYDTDYDISADWVFYTEAICVDKASYRHIPVVFALLRKSGISGNPEYRGIFKAERDRAVKGMFPAGRRLLYAFTLASLRNKVGRVWYLLKSKS